MSNQLLLVFDGTTAARFEEFHQRNPIVYEVLLRLAREWKAKFGQQKIGLAMLREKARWEIAFQTSDTDFKINNNYTPFYARLLMARHPELDGLFDLRQSEADEWLPHYLQAAS